MKSCVKRWLVILLKCVIWLESIILTEGLVTKIIGGLKLVAEISSTIYYLVSSLKTTSTWLRKAIMNSQ